MLQIFESSDSESEDNVNESDSGQSVMENTDDSEDDPDDDSISAITHSVVFKCIGCNKENRYQELLALAKRKSTKDDVNILVKLQPEPNNPIDTKAIAFMCKAENNWERIGYVVQEALDDVHEVINTNKILGISFQWIKFIILRPLDGMQESKSLEVVNGQMLYLEVMLMLILHNYCINHHSFELLQ